MPTVVSRIYTIFPGSPEITIVTTRLVSLGASGTPGTPHILTHPDPAISDFSYMLNPDDVLNFDASIGPVNRPITAAILTLGTTVTTRFETGIDDVLCTELWNTEGGKFSMPAPMWRALWEMFNTDPPLDGNGAPQFVTWQPRSISTKTFDVTIMALTAGEAADVRIREFLEPGRTTDPDNPSGVQGALESFDVSMIDAGALRDPVSLALKIVKETVAA